MKALAIRGNGNFTRISFFKNFAVLSTAQLLTKENSENFP